MSDEKANKLKADDAASEAVPETGPEFSPEFPPESLDVDDLIPGLAEAVGGEVVASCVIAQLEADCFEMKDKLLRALAESENIRRRAERDHPPDLLPSLPLRLSDRRGHRARPGRARPRRARQRSLPRVHLLEGTGLSGDACRSRSAASFAQAPGRRLP